MYTDIHVHVNISAHFPENWVNQLLNVLSFEMHFYFQNTIYHDQPILHLIEAG